MFLGTVAVMVTWMGTMEDDEAAGQVGEEGVGMRSEQGVPSSLLLKVIDLL